MYFIWFFLKVKYYSLVEHAGNIIAKTAVNIVKKIATDIFSRCNDTNVISIPNIVMIRQKNIDDVKNDFFMMYIY